MINIGCYKCGIVFGVPDRWNTNRHNDKESFWCPNGHVQAYVESEADKLRRERDRLQQQIAQRDDEIAAKDRELKRAKKRAAAGTCPCCQRTFSNMNTHMRKQHPQFVAEQVTNEHVVIPLKRKTR